MLGSEWWSEKLISHWWKITMRSNHINQKIKTTTHLFRVPWTPDRVTMWALCREGHSHTMTHCEKQKLQNEVSYWKKMKRTLSLQLQTKAFIVVRVVAVLWYLIQMSGMKVKCYLTCSLCQFEAGWSLWSTRAWVSTWMIRKLLRQKGIYVLWERQRAPRKVCLYFFEWNETWQMK